MITRKKDADFAVDGITEIGTRNAKCVTMTDTNVGNIETQKKIRMMNKLGCTRRDGNTNV